MRLRRVLVPCLAGWIAAACLFPAHAAEVDAEDYRALKARVAAFDEFVVQNRASLQALRNEIARLRAENDALRSQAAAARGAVSTDQLNRLAAQVQEVERNRSRDKQQVLDALERLKNVAPVPARTPAKAPAKPNASHAPAKKAGAKPSPKKPAPAGNPAPR